jgi:hypothetical protein
MENRRMTPPRISVSKISSGEREGADSPLARVGAAGGDTGPGGAGAPA